MADLNDKVGSGKVSPAQRSSLNPLTKDGGWASTWAENPVPSVPNAHDKQNAPDVLLRGRVVSNRSDG